MTSDEIRERYLGFFEERGHKRIASASLVPSAHDPSALLTIAGMHPLKPYFLGQEAPPAPRLTSCQKCFRTVDIDNVGNTTRHLTLFEMLGNFSFGDYFKQEAIQFAWELSREVFGLRGGDIWVTVFEGDELLGLGPDEEAIGYWIEAGVPRERIVACPRSENFWQAGPTGPCGPSSELYLDRGLELGSAADLPGGENERFLEYWNLVFTQYDQAVGEDGVPTLAQLPARNIDTGLGLNRMAAILQGKASVFETDQFQPLLDLGEELSGRTYGEDFATDRALRILADHGRAMTFLVADGVVPSNEDRGYVLRRVMRRAIQQGLGLEMAPGFLGRYAERVRELMRGAYPELEEQREAIDKWLASEEESFGRTLEHGLRNLREQIERAREAGLDSIRAEDAFQLHDTFGFPFDLTKELLAEEGLAVEEAGFERLMEAQRARARAAGGGGGAPGASARERARAFAEQSGPQTRFTGYETERQQTTVADLRSVSANGSAGPAAEAAGRIGEPGARYLVKLAESPFYAAGGGQVADVGTIECEDGDCRARVEDVFRLGDDQVLAVVLEQGELGARERVVARVDRVARHATESNHTATHLLQAALRARLGGHVRQAGSYVGPDKLRFDFNHGQSLTDMELRDVEDQVNGWIARNDPVRPITTTLPEARRLGAMALFGEKYGEVVRMVEIGEGEYSRELCGGTHVRSTAEIGPFRILSETSSAANVRRIEAVTGPVAVELLREHDRLLGEIAQTLRTAPDQALETVRARERERRELERAVKQGGAAAAGTEIDLAALVASAEEVVGARVLTATVQALDAKALLELVDRLKGQLDGTAIVLASSVRERVALVVSVAPELVERGVKAGAIVKAAAAVVGGGGGGRDTLAQAGGRDATKLEEALATARAEIVAALGG
ncbi:MAG TPA: alanine--tRNA ligase [Solirubrobacteraceae bacterium]|nr:alanine--tRNA ligase [Solirubrobacteraceae bacterium]